MSSRLTKEHNVDACAKGVVSFFVTCQNNPATTMKISAAMRAKGYSDTEAVDQALQMQVCQVVDKLKGGVSAAALAALSSVAAMIALSLMVATRARALIPLEDGNSMVPLNLLLMPPRELHRPIHQHQIDRQNKQKSKEVFAQAFVQATVIFATKRVQSKENHR